MRLAVREAGAEDAPPIVLLHGWSASARAWRRQLADPELTAHHRLVAADLRGHGESDAPDPADGGYADPAVWAGDLAAVLDAHRARRCSSAGPTAAWSSPTTCGNAAPTASTGIVLVGAITEIGRDRPGGEVGPAWDGLMRPALSDDPAVAVPALATIAGRMTATPAPGADVQRLLSDMLRVPPAVRAALFRRTLDSADVLARASVPALVVHGEQDEVISPRAARVRGREDSRRPDALVPRRGPHAVRRTGRGVQRGPACVRGVRHQPLVGSGCAGSRVAPVTASVTWSGSTGRRAGWPCSPCTPRRWSSRAPATPAA